MPRTKSGMGPPTPFAAVLTDFMAAQRPIWTTGRLALEVRERRQTIGNWMYHNVTPPIEKMLSILATLNIPMSSLLHAYHDAGVPTPALDHGNGPGAGAAANGAQSAQQARRGEISRMAEERAHWEAKMANTRTVLEAAGFSKVAIDGLLTCLKASPYSGEYCEPLPMRPTQQERPTGRDQAHIPVWYAGTTRSPAAQRASNRTFERPHDEA